MKFDGEWHDVKSSNIQAVSYDPESKDLKIRFRSGEYRYEEVPIDVVTKMVESESIGKAFYSYVRDQFETEKIEDKSKGDK